MDVFPKFIIETDESGDYLVIAKCTYHKQLAYDISKVKGGGWWSMKDDTFTLFGDSHDFGRAKLEDIEECIKKGRVYSSYLQTRSLAKDFKFKYRDQVGDIIDLK